MINSFLLKWKIVDLATYKGKIVISLTTYEIRYAGSFQIDGSLTVNNVSKNTANICRVAEWAAGFYNLWSKKKT